MTALCKMEGEDERLWLISDGGGLLVCLEIEGSEGYLRFG